MSTGSWSRQLPLQRLHLTFMSLCISKRTSRLLAALLAVLMTAALSTACGSDDDNGAAGGSAPDKVTYITGFGTFGREAYAYVAQDKGYFSDAGVTVTIQPG